MVWSRFSHRELHERLSERCLSARYRSGDWIEGQALFCPYYVPLEGRLGADWGVIVNPRSDRFSLVTFEHDDCGCPDRVDGANGPVHAHAPSQQRDTWDVDWHHECDDFCDDPCEWQAGGPRATDT